MPNILLLASLEPFGIRSGCNDTKIFIVKHLLGSTGDTAVDFPPTSVATRPADLVILIRLLRMDTFDNPSIRSYVLSHRTVMCPAM